MSFGFGVGDFLVALELANKVRTKWLDAPNEYASIKNEIKTVGNILRDINDLGSQVDLSKQQQDDLKQAAASCKLVLEKCNKIVDQHSHMTAPKTGTASRVRHVWLRLKLDPEEIRQLRDQLTSSIVQLTALHEAIEIRLVQGVSDDVEELKASDEQREKDNIAEWYSSATFADQQSSYLKERKAGTGTWFLDDDRYQMWRLGKASSSTLLCPGIPGSGKTMMAATVIDDLRRNLQAQNNVVVIYFYCNFNRRAEQELDRIYAAFVRQLFQELRNVPQAVKDVYLQHRDRKTHPSLAELKSLMYALTLQYNKVFIIVDALDECNTTGRCRDQLLDELFSLQRQSPPAHNISLLFTTRPIPAITQRFSGHTEIEVRAAVADIEQYLDSRMPELAAFVGRRTDIQAEIKSEISRLVDGMFLLARLHFEALIGQTNPRSLRGALKNLPKGDDALYKAYDVAKDRIDHQLQPQSRLARQVLAWITYAQSELTISELQEAIAIQSGMVTLDRENDLDDEEEMVSVCAGLAVVDSETRVIRLIHYTTQKYLETIRAQWLPDAQTDLAQSSIAYLSMNDFKIQVTDQHWNIYFFYQHHFLDYAALNWGFHAAEADIEQIEADVLEFLGDELKVRFACRSFPEDLITAEATALHLCAYFNMWRIAERLIARGADVNCRTTSGETPLFWASRFGRVEYATLLLAQPSINADVSNGAGATPLMRAAEYGHIKSVQLLLDHSANVNAVDQYGQTLLMHACDSGKKSMVEFLLGINEKVDIDARDTKGRTSMCWAASSGYTDIVELLVARGAEVDALDNANRTSLSREAETGKPEMMQLLLKHGANVNSKDRKGYTPLSYAAQHGRQQAAKVLLDASAEVDAADKRQQTPLSWAAENGHLSVVKLLLERSAQVELADNRGYTALASAAEHIHDEVVAILIAHSADVNSQNEDGRTPMALAASNDSRWNSGYDTVKLLLDASAKPDLADKAGRTPRDWAWAYGDHDVVRLLETWAAKNDT